MPVESASYEADSVQVGEFYLSKGKYVVFNVQVYIFFLLFSFTLFSPLPQNPRL